MLRKEDMPVCAWEILNANFRCIGKNMVVSMRRPAEGILKKLILMIPLFTIAVLIVCFGFIGISRSDRRIPELVMGGAFYTADRTEDSLTIADESVKDTGSADAVDSWSTDIVGKAGEEAKEEVDTETYFRPSKLPALNNRYHYQQIEQYYSDKPSEVELPASFFQSPEDTILNYFSILREAAYLEKGKAAGCGTLGESQIPYPIAYNFLTKAYQDRLSYKKYLKTFKNILHTSLLKYHSVPVYDRKDDTLRYFVELETIEGTEKSQGVFAYYYGFIDLQKEDGLYKISNLEFHGEDYLCAPYHGWAYDGEIYVKAKYGDWCDMIDKMYPIKQEGYIKNISFHGKDGKDYLIVFYQLTNGTDIEIAQYQREGDGEWKLIKLNPEDCVKDKNNKK